MVPGLYIHVPFCRTRCPFCDFAITTKLSPMAEWEAALGHEMELRAHEATAPFDTVYFGGGTPSLLAPEVMALIFESLHRHFLITEDAEITLEANPGTLGLEEYSRLVKLGVNRLSLGIQSFDDEDLQFLGRDHTARESVDAFEYARTAGVENITIDLIHGLPERTTEHWEDQIDTACRLGPNHISNYALTYEPGTSMTQKRDRGEITPATDTLSAELFRIGQERLGQAGYEQYEVSSFASMPKYESRHNKKHWQGHPYFGFGPSAHSYRDQRRSWNVKAVRTYIDKLSRSELPVEDVEDLDGEQRRIERLFLGLRWRGGVALDRFAAEFGEDLRVSRADQIRSLLEQGFAVADGGPLRLTRSGLARADAIVRELS